MRDLNPNLTITNHTLLICHVNFAPVPQSKMTYYLYCSLGNFSCPFKHFQGPLRKRHPEGNFVQPHEDREGREQLPQQIRGRAAAGNPKRLPALTTVLGLVHKTGDCYVYGFITQIRADYNKTIKEADMLENHIIQARKRADTAEKEAYERIKENTGNARDDQGQFAFLVKSAFSWCVDSSLLKEHNLISPADYLPAEPPHVEPRTAGMLWMLWGAAVRHKSIHYQNSSFSQWKGILPDTPSLPGCICPRTMVISKFQVWRRILAWPSNPAQMPKRGRKHRRRWWVRGPKQIIVWFNIYWLIIMSLGGQQIQKRKMCLKGPFMLLNCHSDQTDQTQTIAEGYTEYTGSDGGSRKAADAERSTGLPTEPSFSSSESTAGGQVPHPAQKDSFPSSSRDQWEVLRNPFRLPESAIVVRLLRFLKVCVPSLPKLRWSSCSSFSSKTCRGGFYWLRPRPGLRGRLSFLSRGPIIHKNLWKNKTKQICSIEGDTGA